MSDEIPVQAHNGLSPGDGFTIPELIDQIGAALIAKEFGVASELVGAAKVKAEVEDEGASPADHLIGHTGYDSIHHAACMLEYLGEIEGDYRGESAQSGEDNENFIYGRWLINGTITRLLRHSLQQLKDEHRTAAERVEVSHG